jgi:16S rRNA (guanine966-N2)-methyltransferase
MASTKSLHIIGGTAKNRKLISLPGLATRPLLGRIKKSLFDILTPKITGSVFLDLYAGTGNVGIEALSRGAIEAVFIEQSPQCLEIINKNLASFSFANKASVIGADIIHHFPHLVKKFDLIFIGPPYKLNLLTASINIVDKHDLLAKDGWIIGQHHYKEPLSEEIGRYLVFRQKDYGDTRLSFFKRK